MREESEVLEHEADATLMRRYGVDALAVKQDAAAVRILETGDHAQQGGFARAARSEKRDIGVARQCEVDAIESTHLAKGLGDVLEL
ncbi:hypothetical protein D9M68_304120 [compost metagenome]